MGNRTVDRVKFAVNPVPLHTMAATAADELPHFILSARDPLLADLAEANGQLR